MRKTNYSREKRERQLAKQKKREAKRLKKGIGPAEDAAEAEPTSTDETTPGNTNETTPGSTDETTPSDAPDPGLTTS